MMSKRSRKQRLWGSQDSLRCLEGDSFLFTVESAGANEVSQLVIDAIEVSRLKLDAVCLQENDSDFGELSANLHRGG